MTVRGLRLTLLASLVLTCPLVGQDIAVEHGALTTTDGVELAHTILRPEGTDALPCVLIRTPYGRPLMFSVAHELSTAGAAVVIQDCRGTGESAGTFVPFVDEARDGRQLLDWVTSQPWCNGTVGTYGVSYLGITQWYMAAQDAPAQDAMVLQFTSASVYHDLVHFGGVQSLGVSLQWALGMGGGRSQPRFDHLPLIEADDASGVDLSYWNDWTRHPGFDDYWKPLDLAARRGRVEGAALLIAGWYDLFLPGQIDDFMALASRTGPVEQSYVRLIVGPWDHGGVQRQADRPDLGPEAYRPTVEEEQAFLARFVHGEDNGYERRPPVRAFFLGENRWRDLDAWPPTSARLTSFYLRGRGQAAATPSDGVLTTSAPVRAEPPDRFRYDPEDPTPSFAGNLWRPLSALRDQAAIGEREDVLTYTGLPLAESLSVAGPVHCTLYLRTDVPDTDLAAKLVDVGPDGRVEWRGEGILRARRRRGPDHEDLIQPGETVEMQVSLGHMACTFPRGHRVGLQVSSSNFPRFSRNLNTREPSGLTDRSRVANHEILHEPTAPSRLELFVVPAEGGEGPAATPTRLPNQGKARERQRR